MWDVIADLGGRFFVEVVIEGIFRLIEWSLTPSKRAEREARRGLRLIYSGDRKLEDVLLLDGAHAGKRISELPLDAVVSLQRTWPRLVGRAALARWLDRNKPGWRRTRRQQRRDAFIPEGPAR